MLIKSEVGKKLMSYQTFEVKSRITMKSKDYDPFIAIVKDFDFKEEDARVIFKKCEETIFPDGSEDEYMTYVKNIKSVEGIKPE